MQPERDPRIDGRLNALSLLADGWMGPGTDSPKPAPGAVEAARILAHQLEAAGIRPRIYPSAGGGISLQWKTGSRVSTVEVGNSLEVYSLVVDTETGADEWLALPNMNGDRVMRFLGCGA